MGRSVDIAGHIQKALGHLQHVLEALAAKTQAEPTEPVNPDTPSPEGVSVPETAAPEAPVATKPSKAPKPAGETCDLTVPEIKAQAAVAGVDVSEFFGQGRPSAKAKLDALAKIKAAGPIAPVPTQPVTEPQ